MSALLFLVETLFSLLFFVFLMRLLLQWARADFRNPFAVAVVRLTNWLILPLRRVLPPIRRIDTASVVAVLAVAYLEQGALHLVRDFGLPPGFGGFTALDWTRLALLQIVRTTLYTYFYAIFAYALLSMIAPGIPSPVQSLLAALCEPILKPIRRTIPSIAGLDLSPMWAGIAIWALILLLP